MHYVKCHADERDAIKLSYEGYTPIDILRKEYGTRLMARAYDMKDLASDPEPPQRALDFSDVSCFFLGYYDDLKESVSSVDNMKRHLSDIIDDKFLSEATAGSNTRKNRNEKTNNIRWANNLVALCQDLSNKASDTARFLTDYVERTSALPSNSAKRLRRSATTEKL